MDSRLQDLVALAMMFGGTFGGLLLLSRLVWVGNDRVLRNLRRGAAMREWPWWVGHVLHRVFPVWALFLGLALLPQLPMLGVVLTGVVTVEEIPAFNRGYFGYFAVIAGLSVVETVVMVLWAWPRFLVTRFDREDVPGALAVKRMGRFLKNRPKQDS
ncbi:hypothetical protein GCM10029992_28210 [Glycomyces albus]